LTFDVASGGVKLQTPLTLADCKLFEERMNQEMEEMCRKEIPIMSATARKMSIVSLETSE